MAEIIVHANSRPISIGVSGAWGVGKSSMIKLVQMELAAAEPEGRKHSKFLFVQYNAWLYQGYDDARAAILEVVAEALVQAASERKTCVDKANSFLRRVNWFRAAKLTATTFLPLILGLPPSGLLAEIVSTAKKVVSGKGKTQDITGVTELAGKTSETLGSVLDEAESPPKQIEALRKSFADLLSEMDVTLVVLIDDLDRCLPETAVSTLEAIRLLLFLDHAAFVIAADEVMIKHAVKRHFEGVDDKLVVNYFDKLIQVPIRVPPLGAQEVRAYMMLLHIENSTLSDLVKERLRIGVCRQLGETWQGKRVDLTFLKSLHEDLPVDLVARLDSADRLASLMSRASSIAGNPRLIKRFMNALSIRLSMARSQGIGVDEQVLAKLMLFERCGDPAAFDQLLKSVAADEGGRPSLLAEWERIASETEDDLGLQAPWCEEFVSEWLRLPPQLASQDLRGALYVSREHAPLINPQDRLSTEASDVLSAILATPEMASALRDRLSALSRVELAVIMERLLGRAHQEQEWGTPPVLDALMVVVSVEPSNGDRLGGFLRERPGKQVKPNIIPKISSEIWAKPLLRIWADSMDVESPVKKAIQQQSKAPK